MLNKNLWRYAAACTAAVALTWSSVSDAARARVKIQNNNVVASNGTTLRGAPFFLDIFAIQDMKDNDSQYKNYFNKVVNDYNMNLVRCSPWIGNWEYMIKGDQWYENHKSLITHLLDKCVDWADEAGIYAVVNMHIKFGTKVDVQKTKDFWNVFAPRYKDRTHVLYEIVNEPDIPSVKNNMGTLYKHVRSKAPNTHLILWSLQDPEKISTNEIWNRSGDINYNNASVGWHSYETILGKTRRWDLAKDYRDNGLPVINTEFYSLNNADYYPIDYKYLVDNIRIGESMNMSWMQWAPVFNYRNTNQNLEHNDVKFTDNYKNRVKNGYSGVNGIGYYWGKDAEGSNNNSNNNNNNNNTGIAGVKRVKDNWKGRYLHVGSQGGWVDVQSANLNTSWSSQKWKFEQVSGSTYRIKNQWTGKYLTAPNKSEWATVKVDTLNNSWGSQKWVMEKTGNQYRIKNEWSKLYLSSPEGNYDTIRQAKKNADWGSQKFSLSAP